MMTPFPLRYVLKWKKKTLSSYKDLYTNVHNRFICNGLKLEAKKSPPTHE